MAAMPQAGRYEYGGDGMKGATPAIYIQRGSAMPHRRAVVRCHAFVWVGEMEG